MLLLLRLPSSSSLSSPSPPRPHSTLLRWPPAKTEFFFLFPEFSEAGNGYGLLSFFTPCVCAHSLACLPACLPACLSVQRRGGRGIVWLLVRSNQVKEETSNSEWIFLALAKHVLVFACFLVKWMSWLTDFVCNLRQCTINNVNKNNFSCTCGPRRSP